MSEPAPSVRAAVLHGAGYVGVELLTLLNSHPRVRGFATTSRSLAGKPVWAADSRLRGIVDGEFLAPEDLSLEGVDVLFSCAEHGAAAAQIARLLDGGYDGVVIDLSADFRIRDAAAYPEHYGFEHPDPTLLAQFCYGLPEWCGPYAADSRLLANPGCFATGLALAVAPLSAPLAPLTVGITAFTGASGSGARPKPGTHFPRRDGNVTAYKVLQHQHLPEVMQCLHADTRIDLVPVSGPWTRGIWGTVHTGTPATELERWYHDAYGEAPLVRLTPGRLPVLRDVVGTPFCDIGWVRAGDAWVVGFALDNLLKGAASQAVQNMNLVVGYDERCGLLPK